MSTLVRDVGSGVQNVVSATGSAIKSTTALAEKSVDIAGRITNQTVDAVGVLGSSTVEAAGKIGSASLSATGDIGTSAIQTSSKISQAALNATSDITVSTLETATKTTETTVQNVGKSLDAATTLAGNTLTSALKGIDNVRGIAAGRGSLIAEKITARQEAEGKVFNEVGKRRVGSEELMKEMNRIEVLLLSGIKEIVAIQKTILAANINIYRRAKCKWFTRIIGSCDADTIQNDLKKSTFYTEKIIRDIGNETANTKMAIRSGKENVVEIIDSYKLSLNRIADEFLVSFKSLTDKYEMLSKKELGLSGGKRKKTRRGKKRSRRNKRRTILSSY